MVDIQHPVWGFMQVNTPSYITGTPAFMALAVLRGKPQNESTELESLFYSMLYAATCARLHWGQYTHREAAAYDAKMLSMCIDTEFEANVLSRIGDSGLRQAATCVRALFFRQRHHLNDVSSTAFISALRHA